MWQVTCSPRRPTLSQRLVNLHVWSYPDVVIFQVSAKFGQGFLSPRAIKMCPFPLLWLFAVTTTCTTVYRTSRDEKGTSCRENAPIRLLARDESRLNFWSVTQHDPRRCAFWQGDPTGPNCRPRDPWTRHPVSTLEQAMVMKLIKKSVKLNVITRTHQEMR